MNSKTRAWTRIWVIGAAATIGLMGPVLAMAADSGAAAKPAPTSNRWRVELDGKANTAGEIVLAITEGGVTTKVATKVAQGKSENDIAKLIRDQLEVQAPAKAFHVETDDGEDVLIKKRVGSGVENFGLQLVSNSVAGVKVEIEKE